MRWTTTAARHVRVVLAAVAFVVLAAIGVMAATQGAAAAPVAPTHQVAAAKPSLPTTDDEYIQELQDRFGVSADPAQLRVLLASPSGESMRNAVRNAIYGEEVLEPTDVSQDVLKELFKLHTIFALIPDVDGIRDDLAKYSTALADDQIATILENGGFSAELMESAADAAEIMEVVHKAQKGLGYLDKIMSFGERVTKYAEWGYEAQTDSHWLAVVQAYNTLRMGSDADHRMSIPDVQNEMLNGPLSDYYRGVFDVLTGDANPTGHWFTDWAADVIFPVEKRYPDMNAMWADLEMASWQLELADDRETQAWIGAAIDSAALLQSYTTTGSGLVGVQTGAGEITLFNAGAAQLTDVRLTVSGSAIADPVSLAPGQRRVIGDSHGMSLLGDGVATFTASGVGSTTRSFDQIRQLVWLSGLSVTETGPDTRRFSADGLARQVDAGTALLWTFGDGQTSTAAAVTHTFSCGGSHAVTFTVTRNGIPYLTRQVTHSTPLPYQPDFTVNGSTAYKVAPNQAATFTMTGVPTDHDLAIAWIVDNQTLGDQPTLSTSFPTAAVRTVHLNVYDRDLGCTLPLATHYLSVGDSTSWVKLPTYIYGDYVMSGGVAGYWTDRTIVIPPGASVTSHGALIKTSADRLFDLSGRLQLDDGTRIASMADTALPGPPNAPSVPAGFSYVAINARPSSVIDVAHTEVWGAYNFVSAANTGSISITDSVFHGGDPAISIAEPQDVVISRNQFWDGYSAIRLSGAGKPQLVGNAFHRMDFGLRAGNWVRANLSGSTFDATRIGAELTDGAWRSTVSNSTVTSLTSAVTLMGSVTPGFTTLRYDLTVRLDGYARIPVGSTVIIPAGVHVKIMGSGYYPTRGFLVAGRVRVEGTAAKPVIFTALGDDSVDGDSDGVTADMNDWRTWANLPFAIKGAGEVDVKHADMRGGQYFIAAVRGEAWAGGWGTEAGDGGRVQVRDSVIRASSSIVSEVGLRVLRVTGTQFMQYAGVSASTPVIAELADNTFESGGITLKTVTYATVRRNTVSTIDVSGQTSGTHILDNRLTGIEQITLSYGSIGADVHGNRAVDGEGGSVTLWGDTPSGTVVLDSDLPYVPVSAGVRVGEGTDLQLAAGTRYKISTSTGWNPVGFHVRGHLSVLGTAAKPVVFTSISDPTVGGDTEPGNSLPTDPSAWNFVPLAIAGAGDIDVEHALVKGGNNFVAAIPGQPFVNWGTDAGTGGTVRIADSDLRAVTPIWSTAPLASIVVETTTTSGAGLSISDDSRTVDVTLTGNDFGGSGVTMSTGDSITIADNALGLISLGGVNDADITGNVLRSVAEITLTSSSVGAHISGNSSNDGDAPHVSLSGQSAGGTTTLDSDIPVVATRFTVAPASTLVVPAGTIVKVAPGWTNTYLGFSVMGTLRVLGTSADPVRFTSALDDSIGGDTNSNGPDAPDYRNWTFAAIGIRGSGVAEVNHAVSAGGDYFVAAVPTGCCGWGTEAGVDGLVTIRDSDITAGTAVWTTADIDAVTIERSTIRGVPFSITGTGTQGTTLTVADSAFTSEGWARQIASVDVRRSTFSSMLIESVPSGVMNDNHLTGLEQIQLRGTAMAITAGGNSAVDGSGGSVRISGSPSAGTTTLSSNLPYVIESTVSVPLGSTLRFAPGQIVKVAGSTGLPFTAVSASGAAVVAGTAANPVTFTSLGDDSVGGDTDGVTANLTESRYWAFVPFGVAGAGSVTVDQARVLGGRYFVAAVPNTGGSYNTASGTGGAITVRDSVVSSITGIVSTGRIAAATISGTRFDHGTTGVSIQNPDPAAQLSLTGNRFIATPTGISLGPTTAGVSITITRNDFSGSTSGATSTRTISAPQNWWGSVTGPGAGAATASASIDARPWCLDPSCTSFSAVPATAIAPVGDATRSAVVGTSLSGLAFQLTGSGDVEPTDVVLTLSGSAAFVTGPTIATVRSGSDGRLVVPPIMPSTAPGNAVLTARIGSTLTATIALSVSPDVAAGMAAVSGGGQRIDPGGAGAPVVVRVVDRFGNPVAATSVQFAIEGAGVFDGGSGTATASTASGQAVSPAWTSSGDGVVRLTATVGSVVFRFPVSYVGELGAVDGIVLNELAPGWVELLNTGGTAADAGGLSLTDSSTGTPIPVGTIVPAGERVVVTLAAGHQLAGTTLLLAPGGVTIDSAASAPTTDVSWGRCPDGTGVVQPTLTPTPATANDCAPAFTTVVTPMITGGTPAVGVLLHAEPGAWSPAPAFSYRWLSDGFPIPGAASSDYRLQVADLGRVISVQVTGRATGAMATAVTSAPSAAVIPGTLTAPEPRIAGRLRVGVVLTAMAGTWQPSPAFTYQWAAGGTPIPGATGQSFTITPAQRDSVITVAVTGRSAGYDDLTVTSAPSTAVLAAEPVAAGTPAITGVAEVGASLLADPGSWPAGTTLGYQWYANQSPISGATGTRYTPTATVIGKTVTVRVTGSAPGVPSSTATSARTAAVKTGTFAKKPIPLIVGTGRVGSTLRVDAGTWSPAASLSYQWYANGKPVAGATGARFTVTSVRVGQKITVAVTAVRSGYSSVKLTSAGVLARR